MAAGQHYIFTATTDCFVHIGATGDSASAGADSIAYVKGMILPLSTRDATEGFVHMIRDAEDGKATLTLVEG